MWLMVLINASIVVSISMIIYFSYWNATVTEVVKVDKAAFAKLQQIYAFRLDMQNNSILNAPVMNEENVVTGILLTITKSRKDLKWIKICISKIETEIRGAKLTDKYL
jgi:hypothetical protein